MAEEKQMKEHAGEVLTAAEQTGALLAGLYRLAIGLGWTWDPEAERWRDREGKAV
jgi:hypothetical protein